ncbi:MAG: PAS domain-containing sensor histidine kinase [Limisphaerales bacterium]
MNASSIRVLLVAEDPKVIGLLRWALTAAATAEFEVVQTERAETAVQRLKDEPFGLVLLEVSTPEGRGTDRFAAIRARAPAVPVIVLIDSGDEAAGLKAVRDGALDYLVKGRIDSEVLLRVMRHAVERKRVEKALLEQQEFARLISENVTDLIAVVDRNGRRLYNSPSYKGLLGDPAALRGSDSFEEIHPEDQEKVRRIFRETIATGVGQRAEYRFLRKNGSVRHVESLGSVIKDASGQPSKIVVVSRDITERRWAEERLRSSQALYHSLVESLPQNIFRKDLAGQFTFVNQRFCAALGKTPEAMLGKTDFDFFPANLAEKYQRDDRAVISSGEIFETVEENRLPDGEKRYVNAVKIPIRNSQGEITGIQGIFWDITKERQAEENLLKTLADLKQSHEELKAAQLQLIQAAKLESVGTLAAGVAHEVKNPLQTILMGIDYLAKKLAGGDDNVNLVLTDMRDAVRRADSIVRGLLQFAAANQPDVKDEDLNAVIEQSLWLVNYELTKTRITVEKALSPDLPLLPLDKNKMEQVFINLFMNAIQAMPNGGTLRVQTRVKPSTELRAAVSAGPGSFTANDSVIVAEVSDTGSGISEANLTKIFDPFFTTKPTGVGTGLGLPVTKKIIELHGGTIDVKNLPEGGVRVTITLNAARR